MLGSQVLVTLRHSRCTSGPERRCGCDESYESYDSEKFLERLLPVADISGELGTFFRRELAGLLRVGGDKGPLEGVGCVGGVTEK